MNTENKLLKIKKLADAMYYAAFNLTTDASLLKKAMEEYHQFVIHKYYKEEPVSEDLEEAIKVASDETKLTKAKNGHPFFSEEDFNLGFSKGAQWQKQRTISKACGWLEERFADKCSTYEEWEEIRDDFLNEMIKDE